MDNSLSELPINLRLMGFKRKKMRTLTLHFELFALQRLLFRFYHLLCRTARCAQRSVPDLNLICTNIFIFKVLQKNNFSSNHNTSKNLIANIQQLFQYASEKRRSLTSHRHFVTNGFYAPSYKIKYNYE